MRPPFEHPAGRCTHSPPCPHLLAVPRRMVLFPSLLVSMNSDMHLEAPASSNENILTAFPLPPCNLHTHFLAALILCFVFHLYRPYHHMNNSTTTTNQQFHTITNNKNNRAASPSLLPLVFVCGPMGALPCSSMYGTSRVPAGWPDIACPT